MSDKQKVLVALTLLSETCNACLEPLDKAPSPEPSAPALAVLRKDFASLLTLLYTSTTKVSLTLRPSEAAYSACLPPLQDLIKYSSALTTCATLFDSHGFTLAKQVRSAAKDVLQSLRAYAAAFTDLTKRGDASEVDYLVRTGTVHDAVEQVRRDLPADNLSAVKFLWAKDRGMLEDTLGEVDEMITENPDEDDGNEDDDFGDEDWDDVGLGSTKKMSEAEKERAKKVQSLLRMSVLLHKRIHIDLLKKPRPETTSKLTDSSMDALPTRSQAFLVAVEETVAALYSPQDVTALIEAVTILSRSAADFRPPLESALFLRTKEPPKDALHEVEQKLAAVTVTGPAEVDKTQKWFDTCFDQVGKLSQKVLSGLHNES